MNRGNRTNSRSLSGSSFKWPSSENPSYRTCDSTTSHCSNETHPVKCLRVGDAGGEFCSNRQKSLFTALSHSVTRDQASCSPNETPLGVMSLFTTCTFLLHSWLHILLTCSCKDFQYHTCYSKTLLCLHKLVRLDSTSVHICWRKK